MYRGRVGAGFAWLCIVALGYLALFLPGLLLHIVCVVNAATWSEGAAGDARRPEPPAGDVEPPATRVPAGGCALAGALLLLAALLAFGFVRMLDQRAPTPAVSAPAGR